MPKLIYQLMQLRTNKCNAVNRFIITPLQWLISKIHNKHFFRIVRFFKYKNVSVKYLIRKAINL